jgi:murein DD-endopeptidase MepM/ murein hydrolase activator NlpD
MKPEHYSSPTQDSNSAFSMKQFGLLSSLGAIGIVLAISAMPTRAETESEVEVKVEAVTPTPAEAAPPVAPVETSAEALLKPQVTAEPAIESAAPTPVFEAPQVSAPVVNQAPQSTASPEPESSARFNNPFIDPTDYSLGATPSRDRPALVFSDRSSGCQFTLQQGQAVPNRRCGAASATGNGVDANSAADGSQNSQGAAYGSGEAFSMGPVSIGGNGVTVGNTTVISREYFNEKLRSLNLLRHGVEEFVFPLAIPSPITSLFGWRTHPIFGDRRFHTGTDLGAPEGTPVVATKDGEVHIADYLGGYGLTVILRHAEGSLETRYAHLSRIMVRPGESVKQGDVIGLVGSTGNSTGPHLHFELRELTAQGWILHDPDELMQFAVANLVDVLNNPMLALGLADEGQEKEGETATGEDKQFELPHRPAQPNAN